MEYYQPLKGWALKKRMGILTYATAWMNLEVIMLSENKSDWKGQILPSSIYMRWLEKSDS